MRPRFRDIARLFVADRRGAIAAMTAVLATTLVGFGGLAAETAFWYAQKRALQTQADAAALSGAYELLQGQTAATAQTWATHDAVLNGFNNTAPNTISSTCAGTSCQVTLTLQHSTALASAFLPTVTIKARAEADLQIFHNVACMIGLAGSGVALNMVPGFNGPNCTLSAPNSANVQAVFISGGGTVTADTIWTRGGYKVTAATMNLSRPAMTFSNGSSAYIPADPYASSRPTKPTPLPTNACPSGGTAPCSPCPTAGNPATASLTAWNSTANTGGYYTALSFGSARSGFACNNVTRVDMTPGVYFVSGVDQNNFAFAVRSGVQVSCPTCTCTSTRAGTGVTIVIIPSATLAGGVSMPAGSNVTLCPPNAATSGHGASLPAGLLFYQYHGSATCDAGVTTPGTSIATGGNVTLTGVLYFPCWIPSAANTSAVTLSRPSGGLPDNCLIIIAQTIKSTGLSNGSSDTTCTNAGVPTAFGAGNGAQKVYQVVMTQ